MEAAASCSFKLDIALDTAALARQEAGSKLMSAEFAECSPCTETQAIVGDTEHCLFLISCFLLGPVAAPLLSYDGSNGHVNLPCKAEPVKILLHLCTSLNIFLHRYMTSLSMHLHNIIDSSPEWHGGCSSCAQSDQLFLANHQVLKSQTGTWKRRSPLQ